MPSAVAKFLGSEPLPISLVAERFQCICRLFHGFSKGKEPSGVGRRSMLNPVVYTIST